MFCTNCGNKLFEDAVFCTACGTKRNIESENNEPHRSSETNVRTYGFVFYISVFSSAIIVLCMFLNWIRIPGINALNAFLGADILRSDYSIISFALTITNINNSLQMPRTGGPFDEILPFIWVFVGLSIIAVVLHISFIYKLFTNFITSRGIGKASMIFSTMVSSIAVIAVIGINAFVREETGGFITSIFSLTAFPIIVLVISLFFLVIISKKLYGKEYMDSYMKKHIQNQNN